MKALLIGFGSIGKRHARNLLALGCDDLLIVDPFLEGESVVFEGSRFDCSKVIDTSSLTGIDLALICSPSYLHVEQATHLASHSIPLFIEKPLSFTMDGVDALCDLVDKNGLVTMVACNLLFSQPIKLLKSALSQDTLGTIYSVQAHVQHYLPNMRPGADPKQVYAFHSDQGGGVALDCGSHEVQYLQLLFGEIEEVIGGGQKRSVFGTDIEELGTYQLRHETGVITSLTMDYLSVVRARGVRVTGSKGSFVWDEFGKPPRTSIRLYTGNEGSQEESIELVQTDPYVEEMVHFIECVQNKQATVNPIASSAALQKRLLEMRGMEF